MEIFYIVLIVLLFGFILFAALFYKRYKINLINLSKPINYVKTYKIRKNLSKDEKYLEPIKIQTFDGSGSTTHPYVMFFKKPFNNYQYYLAHTPYDNHNVEFENPSLAVSNDGFNFVKPNAISDPLLPIIKRQPKLKKPKFYNDNFLFYENNALQVWYRYTEEDKTGKKLIAKSRLYRIVSKDGVNFSEPELMIDYSDIWYLSPSLIKIKGTYYLYYFDQDLNCYVKTSPDLKIWSEPKIVRMKGLTNKCWHGEVKLIDDKIYLLLTTRDYKLYFCETDTNSPLQFDKCNKLNLTYYDKRCIYGNAHLYKSSFIIKNGYIELYIPYAVNAINYFKIRGIRHIHWTMTYTKLKLSTFKKLFLH